jgi:hypothetical protein
MRSTLADARQAIARAIGGVCTTDTRVVEYCNEAVQRLLLAGKWVGTYGKYRMCTTGNESESIITWPRNIETIESVALSQYPGTVRNGWFEFISDGPGTLTKDSGIGNQLVDLGEFPTTSDILTTGNKKTIRVVSDGTEAAGLKLHVFGLDWQGDLIQTSISGSISRGEQITISSSGNTSAVADGWSKITGVIKPTTTYPIRVYERDTVTGTDRQIAYYEPDELRPMYRRSIIPGLQNMGACDQCSSGTPLVEVIAKHRFTKVVNDTDFLAIGNIPAIKLEVKAILKEERELWDEAQKYHMKAVALLQDELNHWLGDGAVPTFSHVHPNVWGGGGVQNLV